MSTFYFVFLKNKYLHTWKNLENENIRILFKNHYYMEELWFAILFLSWCVHVYLHLGANGQEGLLARRRPRLKERLMPS